jgi:hypothetical protein
LAGSEPSIVSVLRKSGTARVSLPEAGRPDAPRREFLDAVREVAAEEQFEILGEMGQGKDLSIVYLARDLRDRSLVALRLEPGMGDEYVLDIIQQLDSSVPSVEGNCPKCGTRPREWGRFCTRCGLDLSGVATTTASTVELEQAVAAAAGDEYEILGAMSRAQGGGLVYFARQIANGDLVALRLNREGEHDYSLGRTGLLRPLAASLEGPQRSPAPQRPKARPIPSVPPVGRPQGAPEFRRPGPSGAPPTSAGPWDPVIELLRQPLFLGGLIVVAILLLALIAIGLLR